MGTTINNTEVSTEHPLEQFFNIEEGTTLVPVTERVTDLVPHNTYDNKDQEIETQFQEVYDAAMAAFDSQIVSLDLVEGKHRALVGEMAATFLTTALNAAKEKSILKQHKDKMNVQVSKSGPKTVNNNLVVADRNDILRAILGKREE